MSAPVPNGEVIMTELSSTRGGLEVQSPRPRRGVILGDWGHYGEVVREIEASGGVFELVGRTGDDPVAAEALLWEARPDFAIVSAPPGRIPALVECAAAHGCHIISEKPLATDRETLSSLWATIVGAGVRTCPMLSTRARPALAAAVAAIRDGAIGRPLMLNARKTYKWGERPAWFGDRDIYGGTIPWIGIHALDFIDAATDGDPVAEVSAFHVNLAHPALPGCEDVCALAIRLRSGALATASLDYLRPDAPVPHGDDFLRIAGERGEITAWIDRGEATLLAPGAAPHFLQLPPAAPYYTPWLLSLPPRGERAAPDDRTRRAFRLTNETLCAREAADTGRLVAVPATFA